MSVTSMVTPATDYGPARGACRDPVPWEGGHSGEARSSWILEVFPPLFRLGEWYIEIMCPVLTQKLIEFGEFITPPSLKFNLPLSLW